mmetsp:Transcript_5343/g.17203  ORF Transcript_5343/g.17203 Transcript_5343/m.17203 type:complete len:231 (+) Transcript_5343:430-1122(+)
MRIRVRKHRQQVLVAQVQLVEAPRVVGTEVHDGTLVLQHRLVLLVTADRLQVVQLHPAVDTGEAKLPQGEAAVPLVLGGELAVHEAPPVGGLLLVHHAEERRGREGVEAPPQRHDVVKDHDVRVQHDDAVHGGRQYAVQVELDDEHLVLALKAHALGQLPRKVYHLARHLVEAVLNPHGPQDPHLLPVRHLQQLHLSPALCRVVLHVLQGPDEMVVHPRGRHHVDDLDGL